MKNIWLIVVTLGFITSAAAQIDTLLVPPAQDQRDFFARAAASQVVIIGTVVKSEGKSERIPQEQLAERLNKGTVGGGSLKTIQVEEVVCRQSDFDSKAPKVDGIPQLPNGQYRNGQYREVLLPNKRYLLLLDEWNTRSLTATYGLDPNQVYCRGEEHNRGVIPLDSDTPPGKAKNPPEVVDKFRRLCTAMRPPKAEDKLALLQQLSESGDPVLRKEAEEAKKAVKAFMQANQKGN